MRELKEGRKLGVDSETTSLRPYMGGIPFSIAIAPSAEKAFYFNFNIAADIPEEYQLKRFHADALGRLLSNPKTILYLHNAKFDMAMLDNIGINLGGVVHDTMTIERLLYNDANSLSLENCGKRLNFEKDKKVEECIKELKLWTLAMEGHKEVKYLHYDKVPFSIIAPYAEMDVKITFALGEDQYNQIVNIAKGQPSFLKLYKNELQLLKTVYAMEKTGIKIDRGYCERAIAYENGEIQRSIDEFKALTGEEFSDSPILFLKVFKDEEITYGDTTATGQRNPRFDNYALESFVSPIAKHVLDYRGIKKRVEFYENFLRFSDESSILHAGFNQSGTKTGRFAGWDPNLQQLKKDEGEDLKKEFVVRRAITPRDGFMLLMLDYQQVEYKLMLDEAACHGLIEKVLAGLDVHQATADLAGITRKEAKTINFAILYGAGAKKIAKSLDISEDAAKTLKYTVLNASPEIKAYIYNVMRKAKAAGLLISWYGRHYKFPDPELAYRGPNHLIQGGAADIMKIAMNRIHEFLADKQSRIVMTIHDELVIELSLREKHIVPRLKRIMEEVYPHKHLPMTCTVEYSLDNLADKTKLGVEL